jgi:penicillin amidase
MRSLAPRTLLSRYTFLLRFLPYIFGGIGLLLLVCALAIYLAVRGSLPQLDGSLSAPALASEATIERDASGVPAIRARSRADLAFATGIAHAQDRFFQMDLMRRSAAGELAALLGPSLVDADRRLRLHGFRRVASEVLRNADQSDRDLLASYAAGVNFGLQSLDARPWEYLLLRAEPVPWRIEDSVLAAFSMYLSLNDSNGADELARARLRAGLPAEMFAFLHPVGTEWDAPIVGGAWRTPAIPGPEVFDLRKRIADGPRGISVGHGWPLSRIHALRGIRTVHVQQRIGRQQEARSRAPVSRREPQASSLVWNARIPDGALPGSNSWAIAATHTADGRALLANDMHLHLRLPNAWYQARLIVDRSNEEGLDLAGVTLPGLPFLVAGSNGHVAWGYTNSYGDWTDLVVIEVDPQDNARYLTPEGSESFELRRERIEVSGAPVEELEIRSTRWGPVVNTDEHGRALALAWTAHRARATNLVMLQFERAKSAQELLSFANRAGGPVQNVLAADAAGHIGWSVMGQVPIRRKYDSTVPSSWRAAGTGWQGWREPAEYPQMIDPPTGRLWTANARTIDAQAWLGFMGEGRYDLGARASQIRDALLSRQTVTTPEMAQLQIDDRALFLTRWRDLLLELIEAPSKNDTRYREAFDIVRAWSGRALAQDAGYRIVRAFRNQVRADAFGSLTAGIDAHGVELTPSPQFEGPLWRLVTERPVHLLDPQYASWDAALLRSFEVALEDLREQCDELRSCVWGQENTLSMRHPLSAALPLLSRWIDMPASAMNGDASMPRVQGPSFGASQRIVVAPGKETEALFQMPGGPVGHPMSPFYGAGHEEWVQGKPRPLLPGKAAHVLRLSPEKE